MKIFPAIDVYQKEAVRLFKGDYRQKTVYGSPVDFAKKFREAGAEAVHIVDLEGAKIGDTPNFDVIISIKKTTDLFAEVGGGIRTLDAIAKYLDNGLDRVIIGTKAVEDEIFLRTALARYGEKIAVGVDIADGFVAVKGWLEKSGISADEMFAKMLDLGVKTIICTDISKDGAMMGTNRELYGELSEKYPIDLVASGGVSDLEDVAALKKIGVYGAIIGKAYYNGAIDLKQAIEVAK